MRSVDLDSVLAFVNTLDERRFGHHASKAERDRLATVEGFTRWLAERDPLDPGSEVSGADLELARRLRDGLREVLRDNRAGASFSDLMRELPLVAAQGARFDSWHVPGTPRPRATSASRT